MRNSSSHILAKKQAQIEAWSSPDRDNQTNTAKHLVGVRNETEKRVAELTEARVKAHSQAERLETKLPNKLGSTANSNDHLFQDLPHDFTIFAEKDNRTTKPLRG